VSALRSWQSWFVASEIMADAPAAFEELRQAHKLSYAAVAGQMTGISPYMLGKFAKGLDVTAIDLRSILLWMATTAKRDAAADGGPT